MSEVRAPGGVVLAVAAEADTGPKRQVNEDSLLAQSPVFVVEDLVRRCVANAGLALGAVNSLCIALPGVAEHTTGIVRYSPILRERDVPLGAAISTRLGLPTLVESDSNAAAVAEHWFRQCRELDDFLVVTVDHSLGQELVDQGELRRDEMQSFAERNVITRAIGAADSTADSWLMPVVDGERLLICSDGLHSELADEGIRATLTMGGKPESAARTLVQRAKDAGGRDNISVIVIDVVSGGSPLVGEFTTGAPAVGDDLADPDLEDTTVPVRSS